MFTYLQLASIILIIVACYLGFKILETGWSYKISKPFAWEAAVRTGLISPELRKLEQAYRDKVRFYMFWMQINRLKHSSIDGSFAEVGVYQGETAKMIHLMDPDRRLYLYDTFEGFTSNDLAQDTIRGENRLVDFSDADVAEVKSFVDGNDNVIFVKGYFPESLLESDDLFAFVHLDADLYLPTLAALQYFYPRLVPGGVIIIHDYNHTWDGIKRALYEFMPGVPETLVENADWQGSAMIVKNSN